MIPRRLAGVGAAGAASLALALGVGLGPAGAATGPTNGSGVSATSTSVPQEVAAWAHTYERDIGILADDTLVVVDDGKNTKHLTTKQVTTTLRDCQHWGSDAATARTAAPPIPAAQAEEAWLSMIEASARGARDCTTALQRGKLASARDFGKQLNVIQSDEAQLAALLGSNGA